MPHRNVRWAAGLLALSSALILGLLWILRDSGPATPAAALAPGERSASPGTDGLASPEPLVPAGETIAAAGQGERSPSRATASSRAETFALGDAVWVEGVVDLPANAPAEAQRAILAAPAPAPSRNPFDALELEQLIGRLEGELEGHAASRALDAQGRFRVPVPAGTERVLLILDSNYLYLPSPDTFELEDALAPDGLELRAELGAWLVGKLVPPPALPPEITLADLIGTEVQVAGMSSNMNIGMSRTTFARDDLTFELRAVPAGMTYFASARPRLLAPAVASSWHLEAGQRAEPVIELKLGARVRGIVQDEGGTPIAGATVESEARFDINPIAGGGGRGAETEADGRFELFGITPAKTTTLTARAEGWRKVDVEVDELQDGGVLDGLVIELDRGLSVGGTVFWTDGAPAAAVTVRVGANREGGRFGRNEEHPETVTGADGTFRVSGLTGGPFSVFAHAAPPGQDAESVAPELWWRARVDGVVGGTAGVVLTLVEPLTVRGRVVDDLGAAIEAFELRAIAEGGVPDLETTFEREFEDAGGRFEATGFSPGAWTVRIAADGYVTTDRTIVVPQSREAEWVLTRAAEVSGVVLDPNGAYVSALVIASAVSDDLGGRFPVGGTSARSEQDGTFELTGVTPGEVRLRARGTEGAPSEPHDLTLAPGERVGGIELQLTRGGRLEGDVYSEDGTPAVGRNVIVQDFKNQGLATTSVTTDESGHFVCENIPPGSYQVMSFGIDLAQIASEEPGPEEFLSRMLTQSVDIVAGETAYVTLGAPPTDPVRLWGRVTRAGTAVANEMVTAVAEGGGVLDAMKVGRTQEDGSYELELLKPGNYTVFVGPDLGSERNAEFNVTVPELSEFQLDLELPFASLSGQVTTADGEPLSDVEVQLHRRTSTTGVSPLTGGSTAVTGSSGLFEFHALAAGTYTVRARGESEWGRALVDVEVPENEAVEGLQLVLAAGGTIVGEVRDASGEPVAGASLFVRNAEGRLLESLSSTTTDASGNFRCRGVPAGRASLSALLGTLACATSTPVDVPAGGEVRVDLVLESGTTLRVQIEDAEGASLRAHIRVIDEAGHEWQDMATTDTMAQFLSEGISSTERRFGPLPPGKYKVQGTTADGRNVTKPVTLRGQDERSVRLRVKD